MAEKTPKVIELWKDYEVELDETLLKDFDFIADLNRSIDNRDMYGMLECYMALVGGQKTYDVMRDYITDKYGFFSFDGVNEVLERINKELPKAGNRATRRSGMSLQF